MQATPVGTSCTFEAARDALQLSRPPHSQPPVKWDASQPEFVELHICHEPILVAESAQRRVRSRPQTCTVFPWEVTGGADRASTRKVGTVHTPLQSARAVSDQAPRLIFCRGRCRRETGLYVLGVTSRFALLACYFWL